MHVYLDIGTGYACAWQNNAIVLLLFSTNVLLLAVDENEGALSPIGSINSKNNFEMYTKNVEKTNAQIEG